MLMLRWLRAGDGATQESVIRDRQTHRNRRATYAGRNNPSPGISNSREKVSDDNGFPNVFSGSFSLNFPFFKKNKMPKKKIKKKK